MIKVAIPIFLDRISPRLDCARKMLILEIEKNRLVEKRELDIGHWPPDEKIRHLHQMGIGQVICGGIRLEDRLGLNGFGIRLTSPVFGEIDTVINEFLKGVLKATGCPCGGRHKGKKNCLS